MEILIFSQFTKADPPSNRINQKIMAFICIFTGKIFEHQIQSPEKNQAVKCDHPKSFLLAQPIYSQLMTIAWISGDVMDGNTKTRPFIYIGWQKSQNFGDIFLFSKLFVDLYQTLNQIFEKGDFF